MRSRRWDFISENRADFGVQRICRRRALRFRIEAALARRLGVTLKPAASPDPAGPGGAAAGACS